MVCLGGCELVDHIHGGGKESANPGLGGGIGKAFCQVAFAQTGISDKNDVFSLLDEGQIQEVHYPCFLLHSRHVEVEVELIYGWLFEEFRLFVLQAYAALPLTFQLQVEKTIDNLKGGDVLFLSPFQDLLDVVRRGFKTQDFEFFLY